MATGSADRFIDKTRFIDKADRFVDVEPEQPKQSKSNLGDWFPQPATREEIRQGIIDTGKAAVRGVGTTIADVAQESRQSLAEKPGSLPNILMNSIGADIPQTENYEWAEQLRESLPEQSDNPLLKGVERFTKIATRPESLVFGASGIPVAATAAISEQAAEEAGLGPTGQKLTSIIATGASGARQGYKAVKNQPVKTQGIPAPTEIAPQPVPAPTEAAMKVQPKPMAVKKTIPEQVAEPIIETTGQGASQRIEYLPSASRKVIDSVNTVIKAAKTPKETFTRTIEAMNTAAFNFLAPLEKLETAIPVDRRVSTRIKMAQSAASEVNSVLENGIYSNMTGRFESEGLKGAYGDLVWKNVARELQPGEGALAELDTYRASKIALKRQSEGKKTGIDTAKAKADIERLGPKYESTSENIRNFQRKLNETYGKDILGSRGIANLNKDYHASLYRLMDSGKDSILATGSLEPKQPYQKFKGSQRKIIPPSESDPYNASMLITNSRKNDAVLSYMEQIQSGEMPGKIRKGEQSKIPESLIEELGLDEYPEMAEMSENLYNQTRIDGFTPKENTLRAWKDGKVIEIDVPPEIYDVFKNSVNEPLGPIGKVFNTVSRLFSKGITMEPRKALSIAGRDALQSFIYSKTNKNPLSVFQALGDIFGNREIYKQFKANGGDVYASRLATRMERTQKMNELITPGREGPIIAFDKMASFFKKYPKVLNDISMAVPLAEYKSALAKFGDTPEGRIAAALEAKKVTYDPNRRGSSKMLKSIGTYTPFWNVSLQDFASLVRNLGDKNTYIKGILGITLPTLMLKHYNDGNPDYDDLTAIDKAAFWHIFSGDSHYRIPIPWLLGNIFKVAGETFYDTVKSEAADGNVRAKHAWAAQYENFVNNISGTLPPPLSMYIEQTLGKSPGSPLGTLLGAENTKAPEVVPKRLQNLPPEFQYTSKTSQLSRYFGSLWGVSPVKMDRLIKGFGGGLASISLSLMDEMAYWSGLAEDKRPEQNEKNYLLLGNFVSDNTPTRTQYQTDFYQHLDEWTKQRAGRKIDENYGPDYLQEVDLGAYNREISKLFKEMRNIEDETMDAKTKKAEMTDLQKEINSLYKEAVIEVRKAKQDK